MNRETSSSGSGLHKPRRPPLRGTEGTSLVLRVSPAFAFATVGAVVAAFALQRGFVLAHRTFGWLVACGVVALLLDPLVHWISKLLPRALALLISVAATVAIVVVVLARLLRELSVSVRALNQSAPLAASRLEKRSSIAQDLHVADTIRSFTDQLARDVNHETIAQVKTAPTYVVTGVLMVFLLIHGRRYISGALTQIEDPIRRQITKRVVHAGLKRGRNRLLCGLVQVVIVTVLAFVLFEVVELRASLILAFLLGVASLMPVIGIPVAGIPPVIIAYGIHGLSSSLVVAAFVAILQLVDLLWWQAFCSRRTVEVGLFVPLVATLVGYRLYLVGGAMYSYALSVLLLALIAAADLDGDKNPATWSGEPLGEQVSTRRK